VILNFLVADFATGVNLKFMGAGWQFVIQKDRLAVYLALTDLLMVRLNNLFPQRGLVERL
jgi:hypothetical protein